MEVIGKTGTKQAELGGVDIQGTTNLIWAPFSVALGEENYTVVNVFWPEDQGQNGRDVGLNLGNAVSASNGAVPLSADILRMMDKSLF